MSEKGLITAQELSELLNLSVETIWRYTREDRIPHIEVGSRQYRYVADDVLAALKKDSGYGVQEEPLDCFSLQKLTYEDYAKLPPETGYTTQLIDGCIIKDPSPTYQHQRVSRRLQTILIAYFEKKDPHGEVFDAPLDLYINKHTVVQPDLFYLPGKRPARSNPVDSLPELIVEILSPTSTQIDRVKKLNNYQQAGIPHYWIVDPINGLLECYELREGYYASIVRYSEGMFSHPSFPGLSFNINALFAHP